MNGDKQPLWTRIKEPHRTEAAFWAFYEAVWAEFCSRSGLNGLTYGQTPVSTLLMLPAPTREELQGGQTA